MEDFRQLVHVRARIIEQLFFNQLRCIFLTPKTPKKQAANTRVRAPDRLFNG